MEREWGNGERERGNGQRMRKCRELISLHFLFVSSFSLHFLFISSFSLHFLAARLQGCSGLWHPGPTYGSHSIDLLIDTVKVQWFWTTDSFTNFAAQKKPSNSIYPDPLRTNTTSYDHVTNDHLRPTVTPKDPMDQSKKTSKAMSVKFLENNM